MANGVHAYIYQSPVTAFSSVFQLLSAPHCQPQCRLPAENNSCRNSNRSKVYLKLKLLPQPQKSADAARDFSKTISNASRLNRFNNSAAQQAFPLASSSQRPQNAETEPETASESVSVSATASVSVSESEREQRPPNESMPMRYVYKSRRKCHSHRCSRVSTAITWLRWPKQPANGRYGAQEEKFDKTLNLY